MIAFIVSMILSLAWLGYETNWMRVRLPYGAYCPFVENPPQRRWQFVKYGEEALLLCQQCRYDICPNHYRYSESRWFGWVIPARTVKAFGSIMSFNKGCNYQRAKLLREVYKAQKSKALPAYRYDRSTDNRYWDNTIELLVDGKPVLTTGNGNGDYKRGVIKEALKPYTTKARVGKRTVTWDFGEADRVIT